MNKVSKNTLILMLAAFFIGIAVGIVGLAFFLGAFFR